MKKRGKIILLLLALIAIVCKSAYADAPIGTAIILAFPFVSAIVTYGLALIAAILIELLVIQRCLGLKFLEAARLSTLANLFSTLIGVGIGIAYSAGLFFMICWVPGAYILYRCFNVLSKNTGFLEKFAKIKFLVFVASSSIGLIGFVFGLFTLPLIDPYSEGRVSLPLAVPELIILFLLAFVITFITEGAVLAKLCKDKNKKIVSTTFVMNIYSYIALLLLSTPAFFNIYKQNTTHSSIMWSNLHKAVHMASKAKNYEEYGVLSSMIDINASEEYYKNINKRYATLPELFKPKGNYKGNKVLHTNDISRSQEDGYTFNVILKDESFIITAAPVEKSKGPIYYLSERQDLCQSKDSNTELPAVFAVEGCSPGFLSKYADEKAGFRRPSSKSHN